MEKKPEHPQQGIHEELSGTNLLNTLINIMPDFIYIKDTNSRIIVGNKKLSDVWNLNSPEELIGKTDTDFYPPELGKKFIADDLKIISSREPLINKFEEGLDKEGNKIFVTTTKIPIINSKNEVIGIAGIGRDITDLTMAQQKVKEREVQLANESGKAEVIADVLHNIGNVLNSINVSVKELQINIRDSKIIGLSKAAELLQKNSNNLADFLTNDEKGKILPDYLIRVASKITEEQKNMFSEVKQLEKRIEIITHILELQQNVTKPSQYTKIEPLADIVNTAVEILQPKLTNRGISIEYCIKEDIAIKCIRSKTIHLFVNLIKNSIEALEPRDIAYKEIKIEASVKDNAYLISLSDNGIGIDENNLTSIFNHGFTTKKNGFGFGLHSCSTTIQEIHGKISAESGGPGKGCTINILIPKP